MNNVIVYGGHQLPKVIFSNKLKKFYEMTEFRPLNNEL